MRKKGQVATFIIIGIVILVITSFALLAVKLRMAAPPDVISDPVYNVDNYIKQCLADSVEKGVDQLLSNGGYTNLDQFVIPRIDYAGDSVRKIPLWLKRDRDNRPTPTRMQIELSEYIENDIDFCLGQVEDTFRETEGGQTFERYKIEQLNVTTADGSSAFEIDAQLLEGSVVVNLYYPLRVFPTGTNTYTQLENFEVQYDTNLMRLYRLASEITNLELNDRFLESYTMETVQLSPLPSEAMRYDCGAPITYTYSQAINEVLKPALKYNMNLIRFKNTDYIEDANYKLAVNGNNENAENTPLVENGQVQVDESGNIIYTDIDDYFPYYDQQFSQVTSDNIYEDIRVRTIVDEDSLLQTDFHASPNKNNFIIQEEVLQTGGAGNILLNLVPFIRNCIKVQHHFYSFNYNVVFELQSDTGEVFRFALPSRIYRNEPVGPRSSGYLETYEDFVGISELENFYCEGERPVKKRLAAEDDNGETISDVNITYECANIKCNIGTIPESPFNELDIKTFNFPLCENGLITFEKPGYQTVKRYTNTIELEDGIQDEDFLIIEPMKKLNKLQFKDSVLTNVLIYDSELNKRQLRSDESFILTITAANYTKDYFYPLDDTEDLFIELIDEKLDYEIDMKLLRDGDFIGGYFGTLNYDPALYSNKDEIVFFAFEADGVLDDPNSFTAFYNNIVVPQAPNFPPLLLDR